MTEERDAALDGLDALAGEWVTEGSHPQMTDPVRGRASFEWLPGRRFLIWRTEQTPTIVPAAIAVIGGGDTPGTWPMHYFDSRGVFRVYQVRVDGGAVRVWRDQPGFAQRGTITSGEGGRRLELRWELNEDGTWRPDLQMTYRRAG